MMRRPAKWLTVISVLEGEDEAGGKRGGGGLIVGQINRKLRLCQKKNIPGRKRNLLFSLFGLLGLNRQKIDLLGDGVISH